MGGSVRVTPVWDTHVTHGGTKGDPTTGRGSTGVGVAGGGEENGGDVDVPVRFQGPPVRACVRGGTGSAGFGPTPVSGVVGVSRGRTTRRPPRVGRTRTARGVTWTPDFRTGWRTYPSPIPDSTRLTLVAIGLLESRIPF